MDTDTNPVNQAILNGSLYLKKQQITCTSGYAKVAWLIFLLCIQFMD